MIKKKRGEIWYADLDPARGSEQGGYRPVVVLQNAVGNEKSTTTIIAPITSGKMDWIPTHVALRSECLPLMSTILLEQIRTIDNVRFVKYMGTLGDNTMRLVDQAIRVSLGLSDAGGDRHE